MPKLFGVVHLLPLPGGPSPSPGLDEVLRRALADADALVAGGADGIVVENLGDAPFVAEQVSPYTVAAMTRIAGAIRGRCPDSALMVNVLRNDAAAALGIAAAIGADWIRINVHVGTMVTDQGVITGRARDTLMTRRLLDCDVRIAADVLVKHAAPLGPQELPVVARDTFLRGRADALIVTGSGTGQPTSPLDIATVRKAVPAAPLWLGSGLTPRRCQGLDIDCAIVGTYLHEDGDLAKPVDPARVSAMRDAFYAANSDS